MSACTTAAANVLLPDETIHLAAAVFTAGFRNVVATLWEVDDLPAFTLSQAFYANLPRTPAMLPAEDRRDSPRVTADLIMS